MRGRFLFFYNSYLPVSSSFFFFNDTATTEIYTLHIVGSVRCVQETDREAIMAVTHDPNVDSTLVMLSPQAMTDPLAVAQAIIEVADKLNRSIICCWMGEERVREGRKLLEDAGIPAFRMPETAIELFHQKKKNK
eukprot:TRINITY_DN8739_c0_g1_i3.p1 TRINITY_DN8739_c0_g1~~TRINITY_DN8739_c0_g1_i3.p1  ORF type:complete len:135 (+),score=30.10 TRINITY_DN8739_c0_g1_i3:62-466(+)